MTGLPPAAAVLAALAPEDGGILAVPPSDPDVFRVLDVRCCCEDRAVLVRVLRVHGHLLVVTRRHSGPTDYLLAVKAAGDWAGGENQNVTIVRDGQADAPVTVGWSEEAAWFVDEEDAVRLGGVRTRCRCGRVLVDRAGHRVYDLLSRCIAAGEVSAEPHPAMLVPDGRGLVGTQVTVTMADGRVASDVTRVDKSPGKARRASPS